MTSCPSPASAAPHAEYRRAARRIRGAFAQAPHLRMRALRDLAHQHDARRILKPSFTTTPLPTRPAAMFAALVRERMDGPVLRYTHRTRLIRFAERSGIGRFEANLIIAAVQHEAGERLAAEQVHPSGGAARPSWVAIALATIATQAAILVSVWSLLR